jgi:hypothetical protein
MNDRTMIVRRQSGILPVAYLSQNGMLDSPTWDGPKTFSPAMPFKAPFVRKVSKVNGPPTCHKKYLKIGRVIMSTLRLGFGLERSKGYITFCCKSWTGKQESWLCCCKESIERCELSYPAARRYPKWHEDPKGANDR